MKKAIFIILAVSFLILSCSMNVSADMVQGHFASLDDFEKYLQTGLTEEDDYSSFIGYLPDLERYMEFYADPFEFIGINKAELSDIEISIIPFLKETIYFVTLEEHNYVWLMMSKYPSDTSTSQYLCDYLRLNGWGDVLREDSFEDVSEFDSDGRLKSFEGATVEYKTCGDIEVAFLNGEAYFSIDGYCFSFSHYDIDKSTLPTEEHIKLLEFIDAVFSDDQEIFENEISRVADKIRNSQTPSSGRNEEIQSNSGCGGFTAFSGFIALICAAGAAMLIRKK